MGLFAWCNMSNSPFSDFRTYLLSFQVSAGTTTDASTGNFGDDTSFDAVELRCTLKASSDPRVVRLVGADATAVALSGRCVEPMAIPPNLRPGLTSTLVINEVTGVFTLGPTWPSPLAEVDEALGQRIVGTWKAGG